MFLEHQKNNRNITVGGQWDVGPARGFHRHCRSCTTPTKSTRLHIKPLGPEAGLILAAQGGSQEAFSEF